MVAITSMGQRWPTHINQGTACVFDLTHTTQGAATADQTA